MMNLKKFRTAVRWWKDNQTAPDIFCICIECLTIWITRDTYQLQECIRRHECGAVLLPTDLPAALEKALANLGGPES